MLFDRQGQIQKLGAVTGLTFGVISGVNRGIFELGKLWVTEYPASPIRQSIVKI